MPFNSELRAIYITVQRKVLRRQKMSESSCVRNETADIDILMRYKNGDTKIIQTIKNNKWTSHENKEMELVQPVQMNIYQSK